MTLSPIAADHVQRPRNAGPLQQFTHYGICGQPGEGPFIELWMQIDDDVIKQCTYRTYGCPNSIALASMLCQLAIGRAPATIRLLTPPELIAVLGGVPEGKRPLADLAIRALHNALPQN